MNRKSFFTTLFGGFVGTKLVAAAPKPKVSIPDTKPVSQIQLECPTTGKKVLLGMNNGVFEIRYVNQPIGEGILMDYTPPQQIEELPRYLAYDGGISNKLSISNRSCMTKTRAVNFKF